jgi:hypothetical protein
MIQVSLMAQVMVAPEDVTVIPELRIESLARNKWDPGSIKTCREICPFVFGTSATMTASCTPSVALPMEYPIGCG